MIDERKAEDLYNAFENADTVLMKKYVSELDNLPIVETDSAITNIKVGSNVCLYHIDKIVYDKKENTHDKLTTVYTSLFSDTKTSLVMIIKGSEKQVDLYLGVARREVYENGSVSVKGLDNAGKALSSVLKGNFPGTELHRVDADRRMDRNGNFITESVESVLESCFSHANAIAAVSGIAALRNQKEDKSEAFVQGMEKLVDSMKGKEYTAIYIADVMDNKVVEDLCTEYEEIYSSLSPFKQSVHTLNENNSKTDTESMVEGVVETTSENLAKAVTHGTSHAITKTNSVGGSIQKGVDLKFIKVGVSVNGNHAKGMTEGESSSESETTSEGKATSSSKQNSVANAITSGSGESLQVTYDNRAVKTLLDRIDEQLKRLRRCEDFGIFDSCVYFISNKYENAVSAASTYKSLVRGEDSSVESSAINVWTYKEKGKEIACLSQYLKRLYHPLFALKMQNEEEQYFPVTPALMVSGKELALQFSLPKKSISGLPVIECAEFGREIVSLSEDKGNVPVGKIFHMHKEEQSDVKLNANSLTAHTFITGSTGSGKSTTIYKLLDELAELQIENTDEKVKFMVIEPAKGEYKNALAKNEKFDVKVYGTNPNITKLLRINPFKFPSDKIHIYEHLDKLTEIFNVCWPMYAAMPAVLKAAMENAYRAAGWNLVKSENKHGEIFPSFVDVALEVEKYINRSEYSDENKSNYKGSLLTRLESLTNGINSMIFSANDVEDEKLFDENVIVDLSRVGSTETKSLIMGILILKLQEYRIAHADSSNSGLRHITVLEEAHNLLKRTSTEQSSETSNLLGKSVEMLTNAIAEMRTYGEGFIIADQSPGLLDMSVIRNTNTKIIMRLPDFSDRELVGKAASLNEEQIVELAKLPRGVAAIYQNDWIHPVLCKVEKPKLSEGTFTETFTYPEEQRENILFDLLDSKFRKKLDNLSVEETFRKTIMKSSVSTEMKVKLLGYLSVKKSAESVKILAAIVFDYFKNTKEVLEETAEEVSPEDLKTVIMAELNPSVIEFEDEQLNLLITLIIKEYTERYYIDYPVWDEFTACMARGDVL